VFTTGSVAGSQRDFFAAAVDACRVLERPAVLVTRYRDQLPATLPPWVTYLEYAPFDELFRSAGAVVHHGGIGTVARALAAGVPQIAKPMARDQFDNADRMERLGVGMMIDERSLRPRRLAQILASLLSSRDVRDRCAHWRSQIDTAGGSARAAAVIEEMLGPQP
jgi:UDP:flavonoid glycosyltransferase YjiC (YdhE family)